MKQILIQNSLLTSEDDMFFANCEVVHTTPKLGYNSGRTLKGKLSQTWLATYNKFDISYDKIDSTMFNTLHKLFLQETGDLMIIYNNVVYTVAFTDMELVGTPTWSPELKKDLYKGSFKLEESLHDVV